MSEPMNLLAAYTTHLLEVETSFRTNGKQERKLERSTRALLTHLLGRKPTNEEMDRIARL
jgi:hypothetical protein